LTLLFYLDVVALSISAVLATSLALVVMVVEPRRALNRLFAIFVLTEAAWAIFSLLLHMALWLERGNPLLLLELLALTFVMTGPFLLMFTARHVGRRTRWSDLAAILGLATLAALSIPLFRHQIIFNPRLDANSMIASDFSPRGFVVALLPLLYLVWSLILFWQERHRTGESYLALSVLLLLAGFIADVALKVPVPILSVTITISAAALGYGIIRRQLFNPLRELTEGLECKVQERVRRIEERAAELKREGGERERLLAALRRHSAHLQTAAEISRAASSILDPDELIQQAVDLIRERFDLYYAGLFLADQAGEWAVLRAGTGEAGRRMLEQGHRLEIGGTSMIGWCVDNGQARIALDVGEEAVRFENPYLPETRSELALPLASRGQVIGALTIQSSQEAAFSEGDIVALQTMGDQLANSIQNTRLFEEARRRAERLAVINRVARAVSSTLDMDALLEIVYREITSTFQADAFFIALYNAETDELDCRVQVDEGIREPPRRYSLNTGLTLLVIAEGKPLLVRDFEQERERLPSPEMWGTMRIPASWLGVPMLIGERVIGIICVQTYHSHAYGEEEQLLLSTIADEVATAVEKARLYEQAQQEIAEREQAEEALRESEEKYRALVTQSPIGVVTCDRAGNITHVNPALLEIVGFFGDGDGYPLNLLTMPDSIEAGIAADVHRCMEEGVEIATEYLYRSQWGRESIVRSHLTPLRDESGVVSGMQGAIEDVTEQRRMQEQLAQSAKLASIGELAAGVAHEINNPINSIINYAQLLLNKAEPGSRQARFAEGILREGNRVASIVCDLLTFAHVDKNAHSPACVPDILQATLALTGQLLNKDSIILEIEEQPDLPQIKCRSQRIQQVFLNLIFNARDALNARYPESDPNKRLTIRLEAIEKEEQPYVRITFHDRGTGIPAHDLSRIFTPFFTTKRPSEGTGLGLSVSYGIIQNHHGDIQVESVEEEYTIFRVDLPVEPGWEM